jgi:hypothetical protein
MGGLIGGEGLTLALALAAAYLPPTAAAAFSGYPSGAAQLHQAAARVKATLLHQVIVVCRVYTTGNIRHTEYCEDGYTCGPGNKCLPGPEILRQQEAKRKAEQQAAARGEYKSSASRRAEENRLVRTSDPSKSASGSGNCVPSSSAGFTCVYYVWNGDPKEIPTPRYRSGAGASMIGRGVRANRISQQLQQNRVPPNVADQIGNLLALWQDLQSGDPNRQTIIDQVQQLSKCCNIPIDPNTYTGAKAKCGIPTIEWKGTLTPLQLKWTPWDLTQYAIDTKACLPGDGLDDCVDQHYGRLVMEVEPGIASFCRQQEINTAAAQYDAALDNCARQKFNNAWTSLAGLSFMWQSASELDPGHKCSDEQRAKHESLRDKLRKALAAHSKSGRKTPPPPDPQQTTSDPSKLKDVMVQLPAEQPATNPDDDILCAYLARWSVRGKITLNSSPQLPKECQAYLDEAKDCAKQSCQMAKIIDKQEQEAGRKIPPWGADDRQAIDQFVTDFAK